MAPQVTRQQRIFSAVVISGIACAANAVLLFGLGNTQLGTWETVLSWSAGVLLANIAIFLPGRLNKQGNPASPFASQYWLAIVLVPFAASFIAPNFAAMFFAACAGGILAVAVFAIMRVGPSDDAEAPEG